MGAVFLGEHTLIGRRAAIKVLHRERSMQRESVERFFNEARATSAMEDPGIVQVYDFGVTAEGTAYLIMEFLDGEPLSARLRKRGALHPSDAVRITRQIASSLAAAHASEIVHRDLKPENLFMIRDVEALGGERPKILDFGIAKLGDERTERWQTRTGAVMGTPAYMSPEQCNDTGKIDHRTDIYSLGCVLFHLVTGRPPFDLDGVGAIIAAHLREPAPVPSRVAPHVPALLDPIVARCLAKNPDDRYQSMAELQQACEAALAQLPPAPPITSSDAIGLNVPREDAVTTLGNSMGESAANENRPFPLRMWIGIATVAIAAGIVLAVTTSGRNSQPTASPAPLAPATQPVVEETPPPPPAPPAADTGSATQIAVPTVPAAGSAAEVGEAATTAVPSKTPAKRPSRKSEKKRTNKAAVYEDRF
jgi:eukaryotic-like serine/threonine-protein kinase